MLKVFQIQAKGRRFQEMHFSIDADYVDCFDDDSDIFLKAEDVVVEYTRNNRKRISSAKNFILGMTLAEVRDCRQYIEGNEVTWAVSI